MAIRLQKQCLSYAPPADQIVYDGTPSARSLTTHPDFLSLSETWGPLVFRKKGTPRPAYFNSFPASIVYLHERHSRAGQPRLVLSIVRLQALYGGSGGLLEQTPMISFDCVSESIGTLLTAPRQAVASNLHLPKLPRRGTRIFAGQPDAADESHFTIAFETEIDGRGIIDGWLKDDDSVVLEVRKKRN